VPVAGELIDRHAGPASYAIDELDHDRSLSRYHLAFMGARIKSTRVPSWVPFFNFIAKPLLAAGVPMGPDVLLTIRGRKTGLPRTTPVTIAENSGRRGLIAPFGEVNWVRNLRAAGRATISVGRRKEDVTAVSTKSTSTIRLRRPRGDRFSSSTLRKEHGRQRVAGNAPSAQALVAGPGPAPIIVSSRSGCENRAVRKSRRARTASPLKAGPCIHARTLGRKASNRSNTRAVCWLTGIYVGNCL